MNICRVKSGRVYQLMLCPFCGKEVAGILSQTEMMDEAGVEPFEHAERYTIVCDFTRRGCGATCGFHDTEEDAINRWNSRVVNI